MTINKEIEFLEKEIRFIACKCSICIMRINEFRVRINELKKELNMKRTMTKRFYVGSKYYTDLIEKFGECHKVTTLSEAIREAEKAVEEKDEVRYIVEIVKIVRRVPRPSIVVEDVVG